MWMPYAHDALMAATFMLAVLHLWMVRNGDVRTLIYFVLPPLCAMAGRKRGVLRSTRLLASGFLLLVAIGDVIAPIGTIFPAMSAFHELPPTQDRILSWYAIAHLFYVVVIVPPVLFFRPLLHHRRGQATYLNRPTCYLGLALWICMAPSAIWVVAGLLGLTSLKL
jgi:uncharacterized membrane protein